MNISTALNLIPAADSARVGTRANFIKTNLVSAGWTVAGSSDGIAGGMDGIDRPSNLLGPAASNKWFVLQSPHAAAQDRIQLLFSGGLASATSDYVTIQYNPNADYADNGLAQPTSSYGAVIIDVQWMATGVDIRDQLLFDSDPPYGWAIQGHTSLSPSTKQGGAAFVPLAAQGPNLPGKPYVVMVMIQNSTFTSGNVNYTGTSTTSSRGMAEPPNPPAVPETAPGLIMRADNTDIMPDGASLNTLNQDVSSPIVFQSVGNFYGVSDFIRWTGTPRNYLDTFREGSNLRARICFGQVTFPWDGTTIPII